MEVLLGTRSLGLRAPRDFDRKLVRGPKKKIFRKPRSCRGGGLSDTSSGPGSSESRILFFDEFLKNRAGPNPMRLKLSGAAANLSRSGHFFRCLKIFPRIFGFCPWKCPESAAKDEVSAAKSTLPADIKRSSAKTTRLTGEFFTKRWFQATPADKAALSRWRSAKTTFSSRLMRLTAPPLGKMHFPSGHRLRPLLDVT